MLQFALLGNKNDPIKSYTIERVLTWVALWEFVRKCHKHLFTSHKTNTRRRDEARSNILARMKVCLRRRHFGVGVERFLLHFLTPHTETFLRQHESVQLSLKSWRESNRVRKGLKINLSIFLPGRIWFAGMGSTSICLCDASSSDLSLKVTLS